MQVFITGVSSGLGNDLARLSLEKGIMVWGISRGIQKSYALHDLESDKRFTFLPCDLSSEEQIRGALSGAVQSWSHRAGRHWSLYELLDIPTLTYCYVSV
ncbi:MAG: SDR family NAD(P)-dependent oxidoreductase [Deltaproteobacteria bacterium]|nr:SDR family NAD(P)-dependent oxidoreductase [Deltaproteobacteria bacterium]